MKSIKFYLKNRERLYSSLSFTKFTLVFTAIVILIILCIIISFGFIKLFGFEEIINSCQVFLDYLLLFLFSCCLVHFFFTKLYEKIEDMCNQTDLIINRIFKNSVYLCGKISGLPKKEVQIKFAKASLLISDLGGFSVNPLDHMIKDYTYDELCNNSKAYEEQMKVCLDLLEDCSTIFLLPDWTDSEGAKREVNFALSKGITIITLEKKRVITHDKYSIEDILDKKKKQDNYQVYKKKYPCFSKFTSIVAFITPQFIKNFLIHKRVKLTQSDYENVCKVIIEDALIGHSEIVVRNKYRFSIDFSFDEEEKKLNVYIACWGIAENRRFTDVDEERLQQFFDIKVSDQNLKNIK